MPCLWPFSLVLTPRTMKSVPTRFFSRWIVVRHVFFRIIDPALVWCLAWSQSMNLFYIFLLSCESPVNLEMHIILLGLWVLTWLEWGGWRGSVKWFDVLVVPCKILPCLVRNIYRYNHEHIISTIFGFRNQILSFLTPKCRSAMPIKFSWDLSERFFVFKWLGGLDVFLVFIRASRQFFFTVVSKRTSTPCLYYCIFAY